MAMAFQRLLLRLPVEVYPVVAKPMRVGVSASPASTRHLGPVGLVLRSTRTVVGLMAGGRSSFVTSFVTDRHGRAATCSRRGVGPVAEARGGVLGSCGGVLETPGLPRGRARRSSLWLQFGSSGGRRRALTGARRPPEQAADLYPTAARPGPGPGRPAGAGPLRAYGFPGRGRRAARTSPRALAHRLKAASTLQRWLLPPMSWAVLAPDVDSGGSRLS
jgi:hypothetical protein